jgi:hypothetical protein
MSAPHRRATEHTETDIREQYHDENSQENNLITATRTAGPAPPPPSTPRTQPRPPATQTTPQASGPAT